MNYNILPKNFFMMVLLKSSENLQYDFPGSITNPTNSARSIQNEINGNVISNTKPQKYFNMQIITRMAFCLKF